MKEDEEKELIYRRAKREHRMLENRLQVLLRKPYLTPEEEMEVKELKKRKLYLKDLMEIAKEEKIKGDVH
ncbi:MAG: DUF465 domain-containing protein [Syntrophorhabdaceae bacterium]|nr:DUF465 domain-containing protein [Syntrophorhabdaceae bacterium]